MTKVNTAGVTYCLNRMDLLDRLNLAGKDCVEIGVNLGQYAETIYSRKPKSLLLVDPWLLSAENANLVMNTSQQDYDTRYARVCAKFKDHPEVKVVRKKSTDAVLDIENESLDFVYVDGNHDTPYVVSDLFLWWPKLRHGGWLAGHDLVPQGKFDGVVVAYNLLRDYTNPVEVLLTRGGLTSYAVRRP